VKLYLVLFLIPFTLWAQQNSASREKMAELFTLRETVKKRVFEKSRKEQDVQRVNFELSKQSQKIKILKEQNSELFQVMQSRVSLLYKKKKLENAGGILSLDRSQNYLRKIYLTQFFNQQDKKLSEQLMASQKQIEKENTLFRSRLQHLSVLKKRVDAQLQELKKQELAQRKLIRELVLQSDSSAPEPQDFSAQRGMLKPPIQAPYINEFGLKKDPSSGLHFINSGLYFQTQGGEPVMSASSGVVSYVGQLPYWGQVLILDHGDSYSTVYSNLENLSVGLGDQVNPQQKLAQVSNRKYDGKRGFYFEIRHFAEPQNPNEWLSAKEL
jgi:murein DD-endopeptidase MepM/ murein hydrolase activator NlpD